jgi:hypothetical protein
MKHIKLFEQIASELPKVFSTDEIKNMTQDEFFRVMEMYYREPNPDQAYTLLEVWIVAHPEAQNNSEWVNKMDKYFNFIDKPVYSDGGRGRTRNMIDLERDLALERSDDAIKDLSMEIQRDEEKLMRKKEALLRIKVERDNMSKG